MCPSEEVWGRRCGPHFRGGDSSCSAGRDVTNLEQRRPSEAPGFRASAARGRWPFLPRGPGLSPAPKWGERLSALQPGRRCPVYPMPWCQRPVPLSLLCPRDYISQPPCGLGATCLSSGQWHVSRAAGCRLLAHVFVLFPACCLPALRGGGTWGSEGPSGADIHDGVDPVLPLDPRYAVR